MLKVGATSVRVIFLSKKFLIKILLWNYYLLHLESLYRPWPLQSLFCLYARTCLKQNCRIFFSICYYFHVYFMIVKVFLDNVIYLYNVFQLPTGTPLPLCRLARPARWRFETVLLGILYVEYRHFFLKQNGSIIQHMSIAREKERSEFTIIANSIS
jgi:hypothetical protein